MGRRPQIVLDVLERYDWNAAELRDSIVFIPRKLLRLKLGIVKLN